MSSMQTWCPGNPLQSGSDSHQSIDVACRNGGLGAGSASLVLVRPLARRLGSGDELEVGSHDEEHNFCPPIVVVDQADARGQGDISDRWCGDGDVDGCGGRLFKDIHVIRSLCREILRMAQTLLPFGEPVDVTTRASLGSSHGLGVLRPGSED